MYFPSVSLACPRPPRPLTFLCLVPRILPHFTLSRQGEATNTIFSSDISSPALSEGHLQNILSKEAKTTENSAGSPAQAYAHGQGAVWVRPITPPAFAEGKSLTMRRKRTANRRDGDFGSDKRESTVKGGVKSKGIWSSDASL